MAKIIISDILFHGYCGITAAEREVGCRLAINLEAEYDITTATASDSVADAVDYSIIAQKLLEIGRGTKFSLVETMAAQMCDMLFNEFSLLDCLVLRVEKVLPPVEEIGGFAVEISRSRA